MLFCDQLDSQLGRRVGTKVHGAPQLLYWEACAGALSALPPQGQSTPDQRLMGYKYWAILTHLVKTIFSLLTLPSLPNVTYLCH